MPNIPKISEYTLGDKVVVEPIYRGRSSEVPLDRWVEGVVQRSYSGQDGKARYIINMNGVKLPVRALESGGTDPRMLPIDMVSDAMVDNAPEFYDDFDVDNISSSSAIDEAKCSKCGKTFVNHERRDRHVLNSHARRPFHECSLL